MLAIGDPESEVNKDIRKEIEILRKCKSDYIVRCCFFLVLGGVLLHSLPLEPNDSYFGTALQKAADGTYDLWVPNLPDTSIAHRADPIL